MACRCELFFGRRTHLGARLRVLQRRYGATGKITTGKHIGAKGEPEDRHEYDCNNRRFHDARPSAQCFKVIDNIAARRRALPSRKRHVITRDRALRISDE